MENEKILIEIAAYCDDELLNTVKSALIQAKYPHRIHFAICYQSDDLKDYYELKKIKNCKIIYLKKNESKGSVYARYLCQNLITDEKYVYQIDAHMRFVKDWDIKIIQQLLSLNDNKAILSGYPPALTEEMSTPFAKSELRLLIGWMFDELMLFMVSNQSSVSSKSSLEYSDV